jgi:uncharacterized protein (UPF0264 family)
MRLLVSVASAQEASAALAGGADFVDAKDPNAGALGAVSVEVLREIHAAIAGARPVTAALGDAADEAEIECIARVFAAAGAALVKVGFAGIDRAAGVERLLAAAVRGAKGGGGARVVAVGYADAGHATSVAPAELIAAAARSGAKGILLDTANKLGPGLRELVDPRAIAAWVLEAHEAGLFVALAGKLTADDLTFVCAAGADIAGVRGAACDNGRTGRIAVDRVRLLRAACQTSFVHFGPRSPAAGSLKADRSASMRSAATIAELIEP